MNSLFVEYLKVANDSQYHGFFILDRRRYLQDIIANLGNPDTRFKLYAELENITDEQLDVGKVDAILSNYSVRENINECPI